MYYQMAKVLNSVRQSKIRTKFLLKYTYYALSDQSYSWKRM
jgi:hypothetical protein